MSPGPRAAAPAPIDLNPRDDPPLDFPDRPLAEMTPADYGALGFLCGLEVHQQLLTRRKLFCRCPAGVRTTRVDAEVLRHMRPTLSELGEYDGCALMEFKTRKEIVYLLERGTVCTYEIDDTPPFEIDEEAVRIALQISRLFDLNLASELQVMRKQYLDGSIPTGFQRTAMVGLGGAIPLRDSELGAGRVLRIRQLTLEEDSCREVSDVGHRVVFRTDRLGTPLIETVTEPDLLTPRDVERGGRLIAAVARGSGRVRRGMGSARQDVNVSIAGSRRVEIKGVGRHAVLPLLVHNEAFRHLNLLRIRERLAARGVTHELLTPDESPLELGLAADVGSMLGGTSYKPVRGALERGDSVFAVRLPGCAGLLRQATQPGRDFAHELAERVRVIACLVERPFLTCSDEGDRTLGSATWGRLRRALRGTKDDALVVVWGPAADVATAVSEIVLRLDEALVGVPSETRQAFADGTTGFERVLPGPERMYPDTDTPPLPIPDAWLAEIERELRARPLRPWEREDRYVALGLPAPAARRLAVAPWANLFDELAPETAACARRLAWALEKRLVHHRRETGEAALPDAARLAPLVRAVERGDVRPECFEVAFDRILREPDRAPEAIVADYAPRPDEAERLARAIEGALDALPPARSDEQWLRWTLGRVMPAALGRVDPAAVRARLAEALACRAEEARP